MMAPKDARVDAYIARAEDFARPILKHIRRIVHEGCPDVEETLKWRFPHFMYKGILCSMASFKQHCAFGFWKGDLLEKKPGDRANKPGPAMGQYGRITTIADLPDEATLLRYVKDAAALNDRGVRRPARARPATKRRLSMPRDLKRALARSRKARATFDGFSFSNRREYVEWIAGAKGEKTRKRRLETAVAWMAEGKVRNWKYIKR